MIWLVYFGTILSILFANYALYALSKKDYIWAGLFGTCAIVGIGLILSFNL